VITVIQNRSRKAMLLFRIQVWGKKLQ